MLNRGQKLTTVLVTTVLHNCITSIKTMYGNTCALVMCTILAPFLSGLSCSLSGPFIWPFLSHTLEAVYFGWKSGDLGAHTHYHMCHCQSV